MKYGHEDAGQKNTGTTDVLKPCPFCGGKAKFKGKGKHFLEEPSRYWIECRECHASMESVDDMEKTIAAWNTRAERTCRKMPPRGDAVCIVRKGLCEMEFGYWRCSECGCECFEGARYCMNCGRKVVE